MSDRSQIIAPDNKWSDLDFFQELRDRFPDGLEAHMGELTEEERSHLERLNEKWKGMSWRKC